MWPKLLGVSDVIFATCSATTSSDAGALEDVMPRIEVEDVDASGCNLVTFLSEASTSTRRRFETRWMGRARELGGRYWMRTSMLRAPTTHCHRSNMRMRSRTLARAPVITTPSRGAVLSLAFMKLDPFP